MTKAQVLILIVVLLVTSGSVIYINSIVNNVEPPSETENMVENNNETNQSEEETLPEIFNLSGLVEEVNLEEGYITVSTEGFHMDKIEPVEVKIYVDNNTNVLDRNGNSINLSNISSDQEVSIESSENIRNSLEINASSIRSSEMVSNNETIEENNNGNNDSSETNSDTNDSSSDQNENDTVNNNQPQEEEQEEVFFHDPNEGLDDSSSGGDSSSVNAVYSTNGSIIQTSSNYVVINSNGSHMNNGEQVEVRVNRTEDGFEYVGEEGDEERIFVSGTTVRDENNNEVSFSSLNVGDNITVESNQNIKNKTEIDASNIKINS